MSTLGGSNITLLDAAKRLNPDGSSAAIAELLTQGNEVLDDMGWIEGNLPTGHRSTQRTGLPAVVFRKMNQGVPSSKSTTAVIEDTCGSLEAFGLVDQAIAELNGATPAFRMGENAGFIEALKEKMASTLFYGDTTLNPEQFLGMAPRYSSLSSSLSKVNIIDGGGTGSTNTSVWLIGWSPDTITGIYPKGSQAGLVHEDLGLDTVLDSNSNRYRAYLDRYRWQCGLAVRDWRYAVRIANIDTTLLTKNAASGNDLITSMTRALERIQGLSGVTPAFYCCRTVRSFLRQQTVNKIAAGTLTYDNVGGIPAVSFAEVPLRRVDALLETEARVV